MDYKLSVKGRLECRVRAKQHIFLKESNEHYSISRPVSRCCNIILRPYIDHVGPMKIKNHANGLVALIDFKQVGWTGSNNHAVEGGIFMNETAANE